MFRFRLSTLAAVLVHTFLVTSVTAEEDVDLSVVHRIKDEAFRNSKVMDHMFNLSDRFGPRVSGSPAYREAAEWSVDLLESWGLQEAGLESWGEFGRGWSLDRYSAHMTKPTYAHLSGIPGAWTAGTDGLVNAEVMVAHLYETDEERQAVRWDLSKRAFLEKLASILYSLWFDQQQHAGCWRKMT